MTAKLLTVQEDPAVEARVVGAAIRDHSHYLSAKAAGVQSMHFYGPLYGRLWDVCADLPVRDPQIERLRNTPELIGLAVLDGVILGTGDVRAHWTAVACGVTVADVEAIVARAALPRQLADDCARLIELYRRRQAMQVAADVYNALGRGASLDDVRPLIDRL